MTGSAKQSIAQQEVTMDCFVAEPVIGPAERPDPLAPRNDVHTRLRDLAARNARAMLESCPSEKQEGAGKTGCTLHPRSRAHMATRKSHTSIQVQRRQSGLPCAMALRLITRSPRRIGLCCLRRQRKLVFANLTPTIEASGPHGFAVRDLQRSSCAAVASTASHPAFRDDRDTPLLPGETGRACKGDLPDM
jgi:hypothetical protein